MANSKRKSSDQIGQEILDAMGGQSVPDTTHALIAATIIHFAGVWHISGRSIEDALAALDAANSEIIQGVVDAWGTIENYEIH